MIAKTGLSPRAGPCAPKYRIPKYPVLSQAHGTMVSMCPTHDTTTVIRNGVAVVTCEHCGMVAFRNRDSFGGVAALFADYRLVCRVEAIGAPGGEVMAFRPAKPSDRPAMDAIPPHRWFRADEHLWVCQDGSVLLLAHRFPQVSRVLGA